MRHSRKQHRSCSAVLNKLDGTDTAELGLAIHPGKVALAMEQLDADGFTESAPHLQTWKTVAA